MEIRLTGLLRDAESSIPEPVLQRHAARVLGIVDPHTRRLGTGGQTRPGKSSRRARKTWGTDLPGRDRSPTGR